jgi:acyl-CoA thioester hydrolase
MQSDACTMHLRARYAETDAMGIVHHRNYLVWFEAGRVEYMRQLGVNYAEVEMSGSFFAVSEVGARYLAPAHFDDSIAIHTWLEAIHSRTIAFRYEVTNAETGERLVTGFSRHVCINSHGRVTSIPKDVRNVLTGARRQE